MMLNIRRRSEWYWYSTSDSESGKLQRQVCIYVLLLS